MRGARLAAWMALLAGVASLAYAGLRGDLDVYLLVVVPVVTGTGAWAGMGMLVVVAGLAGLAWTSSTLGSPPRPGTGGASPQRPEQQTREETKTRGGGVILIGPIPIAWGSDRSTTRWLVVAGLALTVAAVVLTLVLRS